MNPSIHTPRGPWRWWPPLAGGNPKRWLGEVRCSEARAIPNLFTADLPSPPPHTFLPGKRHSEVVSLPSTGSLGPDEQK